MDAPQSLVIPRLTAARASDILAEYLRNQILQEPLPAGTTLPSERDLAEQSGFGRSTVREAIRILVGEGLVATEGRERRLVVVEPTSLPMRRVFETYVRGKGLTLGQLIQARCVVEPEATSLAAVAYSDETGHLLHQATVALEDAGDEESFLASNAEWHSAVATATGNQVIASIVEAMTHISLAGTASFYNRSTDDKIVEGVIKAHRKILAAIESRDPAVARQSMLQHLQAYEHMATTKGVIDRPVPY